MVITPSSDFIMLQSPLKLDEANQITFSNATEQYNYFISLGQLHFVNFSYVRKDNVVRVHTKVSETDNLPTFEDVLKYNYCMYKNSAYKNKWFYAYVTDVVYVNDGMTEVSIETDVFQTWQFDLVYKPSFIEREHVSDDTIGAHTLPENVETGEYIINVAGDIETDLDVNKYEIIGVSWIPDNSDFVQLVRMYGGVYSGLTYFCFRTDDSASHFIQAYTKAGHLHDIINMFMLPQVVTGLPQTGNQWITATLEGISTTFAILPNTSGVTLLRNADITLTTPSTLNGYTPKNNKLFCYPYNCLSITNNAGIQTDYHYEDFINNTPIFSLIAVPSPSGSLWLFPNNYKKSSTNKSGYNWGMPVAKYPQCSWEGDQYTNWMTQNGINIFGHRIDAATSQALMGTAQALIGGATGQYDSVGEGFGNMFGAVQEKYRHSMMPTTIEGQINSGDVTFAFQKMSPTYYKMSIKAEYAQIIDNWFSMYGYKVNRLASPNIHKRRYWDYMKTINVNLEGDIPEKDMSTLIRMFDRGCTFWHDTTHFLDYSQTNSIL